MANAIMTEHEFDTLSEIYRNNRLNDRGITLEQFLANHEYIISCVFFDKPMPLPDGVDFYPLLDKQRAIQQRLDDEEAFDLMTDEFERDIKCHAGKDVIVSMHNGNLIESMKHKMFPNAGKTQFKKHC